MDNDIPYIKRERKTTIFDGILYRLYYSQLGASQEQVAQKLNLFKIGSGNEDKVSRQAVKEN